MLNVKYRICRLVIGVADLTGLNEFLDKRGEIRSISSRTSLCLRCSAEAAEIL